MSRSPRIQAVDTARGLAIFGVVFFHVVWDLEYTGFISGIVRNPWWLLFGKFLAMTFMFLVGVSLVLAHRAGSRPGPFYRRLGMVSAAAIAITVVTYLTFPESFVYFGILHAIVLATLIGRPFVGRSLGFCVAGIVVLMTAPLLFSSGHFDSRWLAWTGFAISPPPSNDFVPVFPSVAFTLLGILTARFFQDYVPRERFQALVAWTDRLAVLNWAGRNSLAIYLLHQPLLLGIMLTAAQLAR